MRVAITKCTAAWIFSKKKRKYFQKNLEKNENIFENIFRNSPKTCFRDFWTTSKNRHFGRTFSTFLRFFENFHGAAPFSSYLARELIFFDKLFFEIHQFSPRNAVQVLYNPLDRLRKKCTTLVFTLTMSPALGI